MTATTTRDGLRPRARRLLSRLAAVLVVAAVGLGTAVPASAADGSDADADSAGTEKSTVSLSVSTGAATGIQPGGALVGTVTVDNATEYTVSGGSVSLLVNPMPLADGSALDTWLDVGTATSGFQAVATESVPVIEPGKSVEVSLLADAAALGSLQPGVYPISASLSGASTDDEERTTRDATASSVLVVAEPGEHSVGILVPITATPQDGSLLTASELAELTGADGQLAGQLDALTGSTAIIGIDPAIPTAIRMLGVAAPKSALDWLARLEALPNDRFTLQFADADPAVQSQAALSAPLGAAPLRALLQPSDFPPAPSPTPTPSPSAVPAPALPDDAALGAVRGARTDVMWPDATVTGADLDAFDRFTGAATSTVLPSTSLDINARAHTVVEGHRVLVTDATASARMSAAAEQTTASGAARELAGAAGHLFFAQQRSATVLVGLDRSEKRSPVALRELLSTFGSSAPSFTSLIATEPAAAQLTADIDPARAESLKAMLSDEQRLQSFATILEEHALLLSPHRIRLLRAIRVGLSDEDSADAVAAVTERVRTTLAAVDIQQPKPVQLITSAAPLPVWVRNDLPWPVRVTLYSEPADPRLDITTATEVDAVRSSSTRVDVPIRARVASGQVQVDFRLTSPTGVPIGQAATADVTLRADWEGIGLGILGGVIALLFVFGVIRTIRRRRRTAAASQAPAVSKENDE